MVRRQHSACLVQGPVDAPGRIILGEHSALATLRLHIKSCPLSSAASDSLCDDVCNSLSSERWLCNTRGSIPWPWKIASLATRADPK